MEGHDMTTAQRTVAKTMTALADAVDALADKYAFHQDEHAELDLTIARSKYNGGPGADMYRAWRRLGDMHTALGTTLAGADEKDEEDGFTTFEFQEVDRVIYDLADRRGAGADSALSPREAHRVYRAIAEFVQSVLDSRTDMFEMDQEELEAAAAEQEPRKAFWLYVGGPTGATSEPDFVNRVLPAVAALELDAAGRAAYRDEFGMDAPVGATHADALTVVQS